MNRLFKFNFCESLLVYNSKGARVGAWDAPKNLTESEREAYMKKIHKTIMIQNKNRSHPMITNPSIANRVLETVNPGEFRRIEKRDDRRRKDRAIVRDFCKKVLFIHDKQIPY